jgi:hypothetical protein
MTNESLRDSPHLSIILLYDIVCVSGHRQFGSCLASFKEDEKELEIAPIPATAMGFSGINGGTG